MARAHQARNAPGGLPPLTEKRWMAQVVTLATNLGWRAYHTFDSRRSAAGFPDLVLVKRPRIVWAELKREGAGATPEQLAWMEDLRACGQQVYLWWPSDLDEVVEVLR